MAGIVVTTDAGGRAEVKGIGVSSNAPRANASGNLTLVTDAFVLAVDGYSALALQLGGTGWTGTINVFGSMDDGATYPIAVSMLPWAGGASTSSFTAAGNWECAVGALTHVKIVPAGAITSGPVPALLVATNGMKSLRVGAPAANPVPVSDVASGQVGATAPTYAQFFGYADATGATQQLTGTGGALNVSATITNGQSGFTVGGPLSADGTGAPTGGYPGFPSVAGVVGTTPLSLTAGTGAVISQTGDGAVLTASAGFSKLNITAALQVKANRGRLVRITVLAVGSAAGAAYDTVNTTTAAAITNQIFAIPNTVGTYVLDWPCANGIYIVPGSGQTLAVAYG